MTGGWWWTRRSARRTLRSTRRVATPSFCKCTSTPWRAGGGDPTALYHERFNSVELGRHLALCVLDDVDPTTANDPVPSVTSVDRSDPLPQFARPRTVSAKLPGGLLEMNQVKR